MCLIFNRGEENFLEEFSVPKNVCIRICIVLKNCRFEIQYFSQ